MILAHIYLSTEHYRWSGERYFNKTSISFQANSVWFKLFMYKLTGNGPPSMLLVKGTRLQRLPSIFQVKYIFCKIIHL